MDKITSNSKCLEADSSLCHWEYAYEVAHNSAKNGFCVVVKADEMTDATSETEARAKANVKAKAIKDAWVASLASMTSNEPMITVPENVTL